MAQGTVFIHNGSQTVNLPEEAQFPDGIKKVNVRTVGNEHILSPAEKTWDSFFLAEGDVSEDFMGERAG